MGLGRVAWAPSITPAFNSTAVLAEELKVAEELAGVLPKVFLTWL
jgi:hypothetical protein